MQISITSEFKPHGIEYRTNTGALIATAIFGNSRGITLRIEKQFLVPGFPTWWPTEPAAGHAALALAYRNPVWSLRADQREAIKVAAQMAMKYWPNGHLGEYTRRQDLRSAFGRIRNRHDAGLGVDAGVAALVEDARSHEDM